MHSHSGVDCGERSFGTSLHFRSAFSLKLKYFRANEHMKSCFIKNFQRKTVKQQQGFRSGVDLDVLVILFAIKEIHTRSMHRVDFPTDLQRSDVCCRNELLKLNYGIHKDANIGGIVVEDKRHQCKVVDHAMCRCPVHRKSHCRIYRC